MASERKANSALEYHRDELFKNSNLAYLAVVSVLDDDGEPTDDFIIEAGVYNLEQQKEAENKLQAEGRREEEFVPPRLPVPSEGKIKTLTGEYVAVEIKESEGFAAQSSRERIRPANGGSSVMNYRYHSAGTLGGAIKIKGQPGLFFISNWHVLTGGSGRNGDSIIQPGRADGGRYPQDKIALLYWSKLSPEMDAAIAKADEGKVAGGTRCFGKIKGIEKAEVGMNVKKCGRTTELTTGIIKSINASVRVSGYPDGTQLFNNQILTTNMSQGGDSGSVVCNASNNKAIGLLFAGDGKTQTIVNHINKILGSKLEPFVVKHADGSKEKMPEIEFEKFAPKE